MVMLFDTSAWVEFFQETENSEKVGLILRAEENFTSIVTIAEIVNWCLKNNLAGKIDEYVGGIVKASQILGLNEAIVFAAGRLNFERKKTEKNWGMMDSFIASTAMLYNLKILTKDSHFKGLDNIELI